MKELKEMTLEELWQLFPIVLVPHNALWKGWAEEEMNHLKEILGKYNPILNHIGSTSIPDIQAKPIIDILVEMSPDFDHDKLRDVMESSGYICMSNSDSRMSFNKGYTPEGYAERVSHIHIHPIGDNDEVFFRDYLRAHPDVTKEYEKLKLSLLPRFKHNRDGYTDAKTEFILRILSLSKTY